MFQKSHRTRLAFPIACAVLAACDWGIDAEPGVAVLRFDPPVWPVSVTADTVVRLRNAGTAASGTITLGWGDSTNVAAQGADASNGVTAGSCELRLQT